MNTSTDPLTGETFIQSRSNQLFANRKNQILYNNLKAKEKRRETSQFNQLLNNNRNILIKILNGNSETTKSLDFLLGAGFNFGIITHTIKKDEKKWTCVYNYAYLLISDKTFKIIKL